MVFSKWVRRVGLVGLRVGRGRGGVAYGKPRLFRAVDRMAIERDLSAFGRRKKVARTTA